MWEGLPIRLRIRAFGYLEVDTTFVPDDDGRHDFELAPDSLVLRLIGVQNRRLDERVGGRRPSFRATLERDRLSRYLNNWTVLDMLETEYPLRTLRRVACVFIDERQVDEGPFFIRGALRRSWLTGLFPDEVERVEFHEFPGPGRPLMLRIYTRSFMAELIGRERTLPRPVLVALPGVPPVCR